MESPPPTMLEGVRKMEAAEVTRRTVAYAGLEIRLVTSAATS